MNLPIGLAAYFLLIWCSTISNSSSFDIGDGFSFSVPNLHYCYMLVPNIYWCCYSSKPWWERADLRHYCCTEILPAPDSSTDVITVLSLSRGARTCCTIFARRSIRPSHKHLPELPSRHSLQLFVVGIHLGTPLIAYGVVTGLYWSCCGMRLLLGGMIWVISGNSPGDVCTALG